MLSIETERCRITDYRAERDLEDHRAMYESAAVRRFLGWDSPPGIEEMQRLYVDRARRWSAHTPGSGAFPIRMKSDNAWAGIVLLKAMPDATGAFSDRLEIGWHLAEPYWGRGLATEAARALMDYGFRDLALEVIWAIADADNTASLAVMKRLGMTFEEETDRFYGEMGVLYRIDRATWLA